MNKNVRYEFYLLESLDYNDETDTHFDFQEIAGPFECAEDAFNYYMKMEPSGYETIDEWGEMFKIRQVCISEFGLSGWLRRGKEMKKKVEFISRGQMKRCIETRDHLNENVAIISINDTPYEYDEMLGLLDGSNFTISMFQDTDDNNGISPLQTTCLLSFIDKNHNKDFLIHCFAGISRSGAIAKFINEYLDRGYMYLEDYKGYNRRVYNSLLAAAGMSLVAYYEELEKQDRMMK